MIRERLIAALEELKRRWLRLMLMTTEPYERRPEVPLIPESAAQLILRTAPPEIASIDVAIARLRTDDSMSTMLEIASQNMSRGTIYLRVAGRSVAAGVVRELFVPPYQIFWESLPAEIKQEIRDQLPGAAAQTVKVGLVLGAIAALGLFIYLKVK